jgi:hypothetical protein
MYAVFFATFPPPSIVLTRRHSGALDLRPDPPVSKSFVVFFYYINNIKRIGLFKGFCRSAESDCLFRRVCLSAVRTK